MAGEYSDLITTLPGFVNAHLHGTNARFTGVTRSRPFEQWFADRSARQDPQMTVADIEA
jgi:cytosine/adenosine deaminase-related metal-dependent hydrolase